MEYHFSSVFIFSKFEADNMFRYLDYLMEKGTKINTFLQAAKQELPHIECPFNLSPTLPPSVELM